MSLPVGLISQPSELHKSRQGELVQDADWLRALERVATTASKGRPNPVSAFWRSFLRGLEVKRL